MARLLRNASWTSLGAALLGTGLGLSTAGAIRPPVAPAAPIYPRSAGIGDPEWADTGCTGCTGYDEGYRWASTNGITETDSCFGDDWARQRGCLAFVASTRLD